MKQQPLLILVMSAAILMISALGNSALASGGGGGNSGGGGGGNTSGGGGADNSPGGTTVKTVTFDDWGDYYNAMLPQGQVTFQYNASGTSRSMQVQLSSINVSEGTVMYVETQEYFPAPTGNTVTVTYYPITIQKGKGTLTLSTVNGNNVMFLTPSVGQTYVYVWSHTLQFPLMGAVLSRIG